MEYTKRLKGKVKAQASDIPIGLVVAYYGGEVRQGKEAAVRCVMHDDTRRSASMNTYDNLYFCFTCGRGGTAVDVVMIKENLEFKDGLRRAIEIAQGSGGEIRSSSKRGGVSRARRTWDI